MKDARFLSREQLLKLCEHAELESYFDGIENMSRDELIFLIDAEGLQETEVL